MRRANKKGMKTHSEGFCQPKSLVIKMKLRIEIMENYIKTHLIRDFKEANKEAN